MKKQIIHQSLSSVRIIAGKFRGRKITFPNIASVRPTTDRLRETAFNWLQPYLDSARCLDAFAGSGILSFEALSRHAARVICVDQLKINTKAILANVKKLNVSQNIHVYCQNFFSLTLQSDPFDIVFLDPPYCQGLIEKSLSFLIAKKWINETTIIYIEGEKNLWSQIPKTFTVLKQKMTKNITIGLMTM